MNSTFFSFAILTFILAIIPSVWSRKCYVCSTQAGQMGCSDANQISQLYADCSTYGGGYAQSGVGGVNPQFGGGGVNPQFGAGGGINQPYGGAGYGASGGDRCMKITIVNPQGPPQVLRQCGSGMSAGTGYMGSDGCSWNGNIQTCVCDSNYCNGAPILPTSLFLTAFMTFFTAYLLRSALL